MAIKTYPTKAAARNEESTMKGWTTKVTKLCLPDDPNADEKGNAYVIQCDGTKYMHEDGYVR